MNGSESKPMNRKALIGKHKYVYDGVRSLFELGTDSCQNLYQTYIGDALDLREVQTYPEWKVQMCFRNLRKHHRKRYRQRILYILPVSPFPKGLRYQLSMEVSPLSSWSRVLWVATFSEWPSNFWTRLLSRRWTVNKDFRYWKTAVVSNRSEYMRLYYLRLQTDLVTPLI